MKIKALLIVLALGLAVAGCARSDYGPKQTVGGLGGAALGGLLGAQFGSGDARAVYTGVGVLIGAVVVGMKMALVGQFVLAVGVLSPLVVVAYLIGTDGSLLA